MTTPFNYTQFLYGPSSLLENGAESFYTMNASGESEVSGEVVFYQRVDPGFAGDVRSFQANLNFRFEFDTHPSVSFPVFVGTGRNDFSRNSVYTADSTADVINYKVSIIRKSGTNYPIERPDWNLSWGSNTYLNYYGSGDSYEVQVDNEIYATGEITPTIITLYSHHDGLDHYRPGVDIPSPPGTGFSFSRIYGHNSGDSWEFTATPRRLEFEWFGRSSGENDWIPLGEPSKRVMQVKSTTLHTSPRVSVLEMDGDKFPKVPIDIKLEISRVFSWAGSGDLHISFLNNQDFFASVTGDAG